MILKPWTIAGAKIPPPFERELKVVMAPDKINKLPFTLLQTILYPEQGKTPVHTHTDHGVLMYVASGIGRAVIGEETFVIEPGMCTYASPGTPHQVFNDGQETVTILCYFTPALTENYLEEMRGQAKETSR